MNDPLKEQVGGDHYRNMKIQPVEYILANNIGFVEGAVIEYVSRWRAKNGIEDLRKAIHLLEILIGHENAPRAFEATHPEGCACRPCQIAREHTYT